MKQLDLAFKNEAGKTRHMKLRYVNTDLDPATVKKAMEEITGSDLFHRDNEKMFVTPISAQFVETIETPIYKNDLV
ncbi:hypothetical protein LABALGNA3A7_05710 [Dellaglioa algida]|uniref:DUF2922 domain-containing protein n=1 Tax=Dellaglioa algida TaxID=105612 RepID=UPI0011B3D1BC|nr:DUF2922 domain-containing protein [Dellaglioa algida]MDK1724748.1 DUF2922 domain-containing protein [Dellaglioa algida]MDK1738712.1 DUF2922 domain-containing protein [Dellaglioa algida]TWW13648.1 hypothetical protein LABALGNA3A7_05710 [Dellaglioa algida]